MTLVVIGLTALSLPFFVVYVVVAIRAWRRRHIDGLILLALMLPLPVIGAFVNPFSNIVIAGVVSEHRLGQLRASCIGRDSQAVLAELGQPDAVQTNDSTVSWQYRNSSPWWECSMFRSVMFVDFRSNVVASINEAD